jgi:hypothetical protein
MSVMLILEPRGRLVYGATASCKDWHDHGRITIDQGDEEFIVTDSLPDAMRGP